MTPTGRARCAPNTVEIALELSTHRGHADDERRDSDQGSASTTVVSQMYAGRSVEHPDKPLSASVNVTRYVKCAPR
jgi:hypothetical protein